MMQTAGATSRRTLHATPSVSACQFLRTVLHQDHIEPACGALAQQVGWVHGYKHLQVS